MSENDIIAEYVKENYPEILNTIDFACYRFQTAVRGLCEKVFDCFKNVDFTELKKAADEINRRNRKE